jgi:chromosomal replication initiation ATPase DnaA
MSGKNYTDDALRVFVNDLDDGEQKLLALSGALPATFKQLEPRLTSQDVARMIELVNEGDE